MGLIKIKRKMRNPKLTTPFEFTSEFQEKMKNKLERNDMINKEINLTDNATEFLTNYLLVRRNKEFQTNKGRITSVINDSLNEIAQLSIKNSEIRIKKILSCLKEIESIKNISIKVCGLEFDLIEEIVEVEYIINFLTYVITEINQKELISISKFYKLYEEIHPEIKPLKKFKRNFRKILKNILNSDLILFGILKEPFRGQKKSNTLFFELQNYLINKFEPAKKKFVWDAVEQDIEIDQIWDERIPTDVQNQIHSTYISNRKKLGILKEDAKNEFKELIDNSQITELLNLTLFGAIGKIITGRTNWDEIFHQFYPVFFTISLFENKFKELTYLRNKIAHKDLLEKDVLKILSEANIQLFDVLEFCYHLVMAIKKISQNI